MRTRYSRDERDQWINHANAYEKEASASIAARCKTVIANPNSDERGIPY